MSKKIGILFVCTGNICRSPTAEGVFRHRVRAAGMEDRFLIDSAGVASGHIGHPPDSRSIGAALKRGFDISDLRARGVAPADFETYDLILAMDKGHHTALRRMQPKGSRGQVSMFLDFAHPPGNGEEVPDPYYGSPADFNHVLDLVESGVEGLLKHLQKDL